MPTGLVVPVLSVGLVSVGRVYSLVGFIVEGGVDTDVSQPISCMQNPFFLSDSNLLGIILIRLAIIGPLGRKCSSSFDLISFPFKRNACLLFGFL